MMDNFVKIMGAIVGVVWFVGLTLLMSADIQILDPEEQQKLKEGKTFWEWQSPHGKLNIHYVEQGQGSHHLLFLHGFRSHTFTWQNFLLPLAQAGYHVWAIDLIGYGLSDKPDHVIYDLDFFAKQIKAFMDDHGIDKVHLIGHSMGGGIALYTALTYPHSLKSLSLFSALGYPLDMPLYLSFARHIHQIWIPLVGPKMIRYGLEQITYGQNVTDAQVEAYSLPYRFPGGITATLLTLRQFDNQKLIAMGKLYASLQAPTLVVWGKEDNLIPVSHFEKFTQDFPKGRHVLIEACGHIPQEEKCQETLAYLLEFLKEVTDP